ncbi:MAG: hypothetical protein EZS28_033969 [Streblomastix strix]|uniref:Uncharacterized protein n=1 Tax=Streblomastix strix TaxID=222440 RepID=A0A5J4ULB0_9EUKA|nr:MAG: hypothetical protein EZS28_033969 [Streblomastix strix]
MLIILTLFLSFIQGQEIINLEPNKPRCQLFINVSRETPLFFQTPNARQDRALMYLLSWPAGFPAEFYGNFADFGEIPTELGFSYDDKIIWRPGYKPILVVTAKPQYADYGADGTNTLVPFQAIPLTNFGGIPTIQFPLIVVIIITVIFSAIIAYNASCSEKGAKFFRTLFAESVKESNKQE